MTAILSPQKTAIALKEWGSVVTAIVEGHQHILIRKGGIIEKHDCFEVESNDFLFYPTFLHQDATRIDASKHHYLKQAEQFKRDDKTVNVTAFATVDKVLKVNRFEQLQAALPLTIYNQHHIELLWHWKPEKPCYILLLKAFTLTSPIAVTDKPDYGGCVSWIELDEVKQQIDTHQPIEMVPVLDDDAFAKIKTELKALVG